MIRTHTIFSGIALASLFFLAACPNPGGGGDAADPAGDIWSVAPQGTPRSVSAAGGGGTLVFIENNPLAEGVAVSAFTEAGGSAVHIANKNTNSIVTFFFRNDQSLPWKIAVWRDGVATEGTIAILSRAGTFLQLTLPFHPAPSSPYGEIGAPSGLVTFPDGEVPFFYWTAGPLTPGQNAEETRLKNIHTALGLYLCVGKAKTLPASLGAVFSDPGAAAFVAAGRNTTPAADPSGDWDTLWASYFAGTSPPAVPAAPSPLSVTITGSDGNPVDPGRVYYLGEGEEISFTFAGFDPDTTVVTAQAYNPTYQHLRPIYLHQHSYWPGPMREINALYFEVTQNNGGLPGRIFPGDRITVRRRTGQHGFMDKGYFSLALFFGQDAVVNGIDQRLFHEPGPTTEPTGTPGLSKSAFVLHFNLFPAEMPDPMCDPNEGQNGSKTLHFLTLVRPGELNPWAGGKMAVALLFNSLDGSLPVAVGGTALAPHNIGPGTAGFAVDLKTDATLTSDWTGSGSYYVLLNICDEGGTPLRSYLYKGNVTPNETMSNIPKMEINGKHSFMYGSQFIELTE
jgi:hypothetical protein